MPFLKGLMPIRRTAFHLNQGTIVLRREVQVLAFYWHIKNDSSQGLRDFAFWHWAQLQWKNPQIQIVKAINLLPSPIIQAFLEDGREVLFDVHGKRKDEITKQLVKTLGKTDIVEERERMEALIEDNPANFGTKCDRQCMCEVSGQQPCPYLLEVPKYMKGSWRWNKNLMN